MLQEQINQFCSELGIEAPKPNKSSLFSLILNPQVQVSLLELKPGCSMQAVICPCPQKKREELFIYLARANFLGQGTGGARIGLDAEEKLLTLSHGFSYELNYPAFKESVEDFVNYLAYWREEIAKFDKDAQP